MAMSFILFTVLISSICFSSVQPSNNGGITMDFIHRDSTSSPSYDSSHTHFERLRRAIDRSFLRKSWLASSALSSASLSSSSTESVDAPISNAGGEYLMKIKVGTPGVEQLVIADTGSDLLWMQCKPCTSCYKQNIPLFDPSKTSTYRPVSCQSSQCEAANAQCDSSNSCQYQVQYGDRSYSYGEVAADTIRFDGGVSFPKVAFGCGHENAGTFSPAGAGIIGLGGGAISIINQLDRVIGGKFSYCLTLLNSNASSKISFGSDAVVAGPKVVSTPLIKKSPPTFYFLTLEGFSVGEERVDYKSSSSKAFGDDAEGNIIIDSGTTLTFVPSDIYDEVEAELEKVIKGTRVSDSRGSFKLCYQIESGSGLSSPPITAHFRGADLVLPRESIFLEVEQGVACLTLVPSQDLAIFGNLHQMNYKVGYDTVNEKVSFLPTDCSNSE